MGYGLMEKVNHIRIRSKNNVFKGKTYLNISSEIRVSRERKQSMCLICGHVC